MNGSGRTCSKLVLLCVGLFACFTACSSHCMFPEKDGGNTIKGMFVFGSSLVDNGNNNFLETKAKADYLPYGIDFPGGPSGRFTNGKNVVDLLCDQLKLPLIPPFQNPSTKGINIVHGVNHASGSAGILDETGIVAGNVTSMNQQIRDFEEVTLPELEAQLRCSSNKSLQNYIFVIGIGGNDYMFNYFLRKMIRGVGLEFFTRKLIASLSQQLMKLYELGGRKFVLTTINPIGFCPVINVKMPLCTFCPKAMNHAALKYNYHLLDMVDTIELQMPGSNLVVINSYNVIMDIIDNPSFKGFDDTSRACCEVLSGMEGGNGVSCKRDGQACEDRRSHVFFDGIHPTEAVNVYIATKAYLSDLKYDVYPINVRQLAQL